MVDSAVAMSNWDLVPRHTALLCNPSKAAGASRVRSFVVAGSGEAIGSSSPVASVGRNSRRAVRMLRRCVAGADGEHHLQRGDTGCECGSDHDALQTASLVLTRRARVAGTGEAVRTATVTASRGPDPGFGAGCRWRSRHARVTRISADFGLFLAGPLKNDALCMPTCEFVSPGSTSRRR
jgi:hypothetical protein